MGYMEYRYYISYAHITSKGPGFGSCGFNINTELDSSDKVLAVSEQIAIKEGLEKCIILSFQLLKKVDLPTERG